MNIWELCRGKTFEELIELQYQLVARDNLMAAAAVSTWMRLFGNNVQVVKGKKVPIGTEGKVFFIKSQHYSKSPFFGWSYLVGIEKADGTKVFTNANNVKVVEQ